MLLKLFFDQPDAKPLVLALRRFFVLGGQACKKDHQDEFTLEQIDKLFEDDFHQALGEEIQEEIVNEKTD